MPDINADMAATVWKIEKSEGDVVDVGDIILILESMKMEIPVEAEESGSLDADRRRRRRLGGGRATARPNQLMPQTADEK